MLVLLGPVVIAIGYGIFIAFMNAKSKTNLPISRPRVNSDEFDQYGDPIFDAKGMYLPGKRPV